MSGPDDLAEADEWPVFGADFFAAGEPMRRRLDADRTRGLAPGSPDWRLFALTLADEAVMPAALAAMGLTHRTASHVAKPTWWPDAAGPVLEMAEGADMPATVAVEAWLGRWVLLPERAIHGSCMLELAAHRFGMTRGKAAFRLAKLLGRDVPRVPAP